LAQLPTVSEDLATPPDPRAVPAILTDAADTFGLKISRLQPQGNGAQLTLEDAPFDSVLLWIEALQRDDALRLIDLTLTRRPAPGIVGATLTMER
jgi:general secretion pathway protein M